MACANEFVWRTYSTDIWILYKFPTSIIITFVFAIAQTPFLLKHQIDKPEAEAAAIEDNDGADD